MYILSFMKPPPINPNPFNVTRLIIHAGRVYRFETPQPAGKNEELCTTGVIY